MLPLIYRAPGAVCKGLPSAEEVEQHLKLCTGSTHYKPKQSVPKCVVVQRSSYATDVSSWKATNSTGGMVSASEADSSNGIVGCSSGSAGIGAMVVTNVTMPHYEKDRNLPEMMNKYDITEGRGSDNASSVELFPLQSQSDCIVRKSVDDILLTDYFCFLMCQFRATKFQKSDRKVKGNGKRNNIPLGFGGLECRHCVSRKSGGRKFFWSNVDMLSNSLAEFPSHLLKCKHCPTTVKNKLAILKTTHSNQMSKIPRGSQKVYLRRLWRRLHEHDDSSPAKAKREAQDSNDMTVPTKKQKMASDDASIASSVTTDPAISTEMVKFHQNKVLLAVNDDKDWLSDADCFLRDNLEVFCATKNDVDEATKNEFRLVTRGRVGVRCIHCQSATNSVYPVSLNELYESVNSFANMHFKSKCKESVRNEYLNLLDRSGKRKSKKTLPAVLKRHYIYGATDILKLIDSPIGISASKESILVTRQNNEQDLSSFYANLKDESIEKRRSNSMLSNKSDATTSSNKSDPLDLFVQVALAQTPIPTKNR